jgi:DNA-binding NtrC family response regulator
VGGSRTIRADIRIVAATNRDLVRAIERGAFREDLYYRLNVFAIRLPPLRERRDDILAMADAFMVEIGRSLGRPPAGLARDAASALVEHPWPGNARELRNAIERAAILADGGLIVRDHLALAGAPAPAAPPRPAPPETSTEEAPGERAKIERALQAARFNKAKAARALGLTRAQLYVRLKRHGLE